MALRGTLEDFGIADILQIINHQSKTGTLKVRSGKDMISIHVSDGFVVRAFPQNREKKDLLGRLLVRSEAVSEQGLDKALALQKTSGGRLGRCLVESGEVPSDVLRHFVRLQSMETLYRIFLFEHGNYDFVSEPVPDSDSFEALRVDHLLMEGLRQADEWPLLRKRLPGYGMRFTKKVDLEELMALESESDSDNDDDFFDGVDEFGGGGPSRLRQISDREVTIYKLIAFDRDVQKIIDLARLGEFETCKALVNLLDADILEVVPDSGPEEPSAEAWVGGLEFKSSGWRSGWFPGLLAIASAVMFIFVLPLWGALPRVLTPATLSWEQSVDLNRLHSKSVERKIRHALHRFKLETGSYPKRLDSVVERELLQKKDLNGPWRDRFFYRPTKDAYILLPPFD